MTFCFTAALKRSCCILLSYESVFKGLMHSYKSLEVRMSSAMRSIWHMCILPGHCPIYEFSHTERPHRRSEGFLKTIVRDAHVSAGRLPSISCLLTIPRMSSLRQTLAQVGMQGGRPNLTRLCSCEQKKPVASLPRLCTTQMVNNCCYNPFLFQKTEMLQ